jgi:hypothetical protein
VRFLRQIVPLGELQRDGKTVLITRMFGDDIEKMIGVVAESTTPADLSALEAIVAAQGILINSLVLANTDLIARVEKLEDRYQS